MHVAITLDLNPQRHRITRLDLLWLCLSFGTEMANGASEVRRASLLRQGQHLHRQGHAAHHEGLPATEYGIVEHTQCVEEATPIAPLRNRTGDHQRFDGVLPVTCRKQCDASQRRDIEGNAVDDFLLWRQPLRDKQLLHPEPREGRNLGEADVAQIEPITQIKTNDHLLPDVGRIALDDSPNKEHVFDRFCVIGCRLPGLLLIAAHDLDVNRFRRQGRAAEGNAGRPDSEATEFLAI